MERDFGEQSGCSSPEPPDINERWQLCHGQGCAGCSSLPHSCQGSNCNLFLLCSGSSREQELNRCPVPWTGDPARWDAPVLCHAMSPPSASTETAPGASIAAILMLGMRSNKNIHEEAFVYPSSLERSAVKGWTGRVARSQYLSNISRAEMAVLDI